MAATKFSRFERAATCHPPLAEPLESRTLLSTVHTVPHHRPDHVGGADTVAFGLPQLSAVLLNQFPPSALPRSRQTTTLRIYNRGTGNATGNIKVQFLASVDGSIAGSAAVLGTFNESLRLAPGAYKTSAFSFTLPRNLPTGSYRVLAVVDAANAIPKAAASTTVVSSPPITIAPAFVHLISALTQAPTTVPIENLSTITVSLTNTGNTTAAGKVSVSLFQSPTQALGASSNLLNTFSRLSIDIPANTTQRLILTQKTPATTVAGSQFLIAQLSTPVPKIDSQSSEAAATFPTLFQTDTFTAVPASIIVGRRAPISIELDNASASPARGTVSVSLYQSPTRVLDSGATLLQTFSTEPVRINANSIQTLNLSVLVPTDTPVQTSYVIAVLDSTGTLAGNRATNNTIVSLSPTQFVVK